MAAPVVVQAKTSAYSNASTTTLVLDTAPTPGNLLLAIHQAFGVNTMLTLAGWTPRTNLASSALFVHSRIVQAGDGASYTWPVTGAMHADLTMLEISGQASDTMIGLSDDKLGPTGNTHAAQVIMPPPDSLLVVGVRGSQVAASYTLTSPGWTTHNQSQIGGAVYLGGCYTRPFVIPDTNTLITYTSSVGCNIRYTSFAVPGSASVQSIVGQVAIESLLTAVPAAQVGHIAVEALHRAAPTISIGQVAIEAVQRGAGTVKVTQAVVEVLHSGTLTPTTPLPPARGYKLPPRVG